MNSRNNGRLNSSFRLVNLWKWWLVKERAKNDDMSRCSITARQTSLLRLWRDGVARGASGWASAVDILEKVEVWGVIRSRVIDFGVVVWVEL